MLPAGNENGNRPTTCAENAGAGKDRVSLPTSADARLACWVSMAICESDPLRGEQAIRQISDQRYSHEMMSQRL